MQVGFFLTPLGRLTNVRDKEWTVDLRPPQLIASPGYPRHPSPRQNIAKLHSTKENCSLRPSCSFTLF